MLLAEFGTGQVFWSMLWFFLFFIWIWLLISLFGDIFRSKDLSGGAKALWTIFIIILPFLGVLVYLIVRGNSMPARSRRAAMRCGGRSPWRRCGRRWRRRSPWPRSRSAARRSTPSRPRRP